LKDIKRMLKIRTRVMLDILLCISFIWLVPVFAHNERKGIKQEWREWKFCVHLLGLEWYFSERFTNTQRVTLYNEEFEYDD